MSKRKIYFRADGNSQIGLGHVTRSLALAGMLRVDFECIFMIQAPSASIIEEIKKNCQGLIILGETTNYIREASEITEKYFSPDDIVVLDSYGFNTAYQKVIKSKGCKLVCIDDLHDKEFVADLIINHAPGVKKEDYKAQSYTKFALGPEYVLLRPLFVEQAKKKRRIEKLETALICFGGSDIKNLTKSTLKVVVGFKQFKNIIVIIGSAYNYFDSLKPLITSDKRISLHQSVNEKKIISLMYEAGIAIVPASSILLELFTIGVPAITGYYSDNQKEVSENVAKMGLAFTCGNMLFNYSEYLRIRIDNLSLEKGNLMVQKQKAINWNGAGSFLNIFKDI